MALLTLSTEVLELVTRYALAQDCISAHGDMSALGICCKTTEEMFGPILRRRACILTLHKFLIEYGILGATSTYGGTYYVADHDENTAEYKRYIAEPFFWHTLGEALFHPGLPIDKLVLSQEDCLDTSRYIGGTLIQEDCHHVDVGILTQHKTNWCCIRLQKKRFRELYGLHCD